MELHAIEKGAIPDVSYQEHVKRSGVCPGKKYLSTEPCAIGLLWTFGALEKKRRWTLFEVNT